jgi:hypothetical protein
VLWDQATAQQHLIQAQPPQYGPGFAAALHRYTLQRVLQLVLFLDRAAQQKLLPLCLFVKVRFVPLFYCL